MHAIRNHREQRVRVVENSLAEADKRIVNLRAELRELENSLVQEAFSTKAPPPVKADPELMRNKMHVVRQLESEVSQLDVAIEEAKHHENALQSPSPGYTIGEDNADVSEVARLEEELRTLDETILSETDALHDFALSRPSGTTLWSL